MRMTKSSMFLEEPVRTQQSQPHHNFDSRQHNEQHCLPSRLPSVTRLQWESSLALKSSLQAQTSHHTSHKPDSVFFRISVL
jgi:hypothetical protein